MKRFALFEERVLEWGIEQRVIDQIEEEFAPWKESGIHREQQEKLLSDRQHWCSQCGYKAAKQFALEQNIKAYKKYFRHAILAKKSQEIK